VYDQSIMSRGLIAACGILAGAGLAMWLGGRMPRRASRETDEWVDEGAVTSSVRSVSIDDDTAAEIISRARPALDRAAKLL
jgi:hypothetical protein